MGATQTRSAAEVLEDHLRESQVATIDDDLARNYAEDLVVLTSHGVFRGHDGLRHVAQHLDRQLKKGRSPRPCIVCTGPTLD